MSIETIKAAFHICRLSASSGEETIRVEFRAEDKSGLLIRSTMTPEQFALGLTARVVSDVEVEVVRRGVKP